jgi:hypothetical protein
MTSAASASQSRKLPEPAGQQDAAVGQTRKASGVGRSVAGLPGLVTLTLVASAAGSRRMPDVLQAVRLLLFRGGGLMIGHGLGGAGHRDMVRNEEERDGGAATRRPVRVRRRGRHIPVVADLAWSGDFWVDVAGS